jgi:spore germination cell wall hydrolase CwlJ-like protein
MKLIQVKILAVVVVLALVTFFYQENEPRNLQKEAEIKALALNIYYEARGIRPPDPSIEELGWRTVTAVVFNRLEDKRFPKTIEGVIYEKSSSSGKYQFSWVGDNISNEPTDKKLYQEILQEARRYLDEYRAGKWRDVTFGAHSYHAKSMKPNMYFKKLVPTVSVQTRTQGHIFYKDRA